jgi:hypothetical protein
MKGEIIMNKLMARIVAVVLAVMMLGTVSFAATSLTETNDVIKAEVDTLESGIYTVKAYTDVTKTIVAMHQGAKPGDIAINPEKIDATDNNIIVEFSGKGATKTTVELPVNRKPENEKAIASVGNTYEFNGKTYTGVAHITHAFSPKAAVSKLGYYLTAKKGEKTSQAKEVAYKGTTITGDGSVAFDVVVLSVPEDVTISAEYFIEY